MRALGLARRILTSQPLGWLWPYLVVPPVIATILVSSTKEIPLSSGLHVLTDVSVFVVCIGAPVHLAYVHLGRRLGLRGRLSLRELSIHVVILGAGVLVGTEVAFWILGPHEHGRLPSRAGVWSMGLASNVLVTTMMIGRAIRRDRIQEMKLLALRARQESLTAQVEALQARIQPHFLFNALNTVASLIAADPQRAETAVERLSDLFRYTLDASKRARVPLGEELAAVEGFLELETLRYGSRLKAALHVDAGARDARVPPLILQPLVENAVLHGLAPRREGGRIEVLVEQTAEALVLRVEDDGPGPGASPRRGSGTALVDLRRRLALLYGSAARLEVGRAAIGGFRVEIVLPLDEEAEGQP
jgi:two-component system, LytTR family, sensor histidine kinase AlgZ